MLFYFYYYLQKSKKIKKKFKIQKKISRVNRIFPSKPSPPGQTMSTRVKNEFRVKTVIFDQN